MSVDPHMSTYPNVQHKKTEGTLTLSATHLSFLLETHTDAAAMNTVHLAWTDLDKHQVSPPTHPKALLKLLLKKNGTSLTFKFPTRESLERARRDITALKSTAPPTTISGEAPAITGRRKRKRLENTTPFGEMDATALAVTRSSLLASHPTLRAQHQYLVEETLTVLEEDFWKTHQSLLEEEHAKICGTTKAGTSSLLQSHLPLQGKVTLGVEEMRQIFILYPAVHKAYEEKVPLELSDEQFWRKYLESEYFHRDRGRMGTAARNQGRLPSKGSKKNTTVTGKSNEQEEARAAAVGTDDLFSRYDAKLRQEAGGTSTTTTTTATLGNNGKTPPRWNGNKLAVGQFDLAATHETERGFLLEGPRDDFPPNATDAEKGARVIQKYNRHWAMVLHPDQAVAGTDLMEVARQRSSRAQDEDEEEAKPMGGYDKEMQQLVGYANASEEDANHVRGTDIEDDGYEELSLANVEAYYSGQQQHARQASNNESEQDKRKRQAIVAKAMLQKVKRLAAPYLQSAAPRPPAIQHECFPPASLGRELLLALTKKMAADAQTEEDALEVVNKLPDDFKKRLHTYFRRSSELLRHFFGLRKLDANREKQKLDRIVKGLEAVYREIEGVRKELPQTELGEVMRKMCLPIMDQLDWAFQLHREGSGVGGSGGFVTVEEL